MKNILKASFILFCCTVYAGQVQVVQTVNPAATSLYQLCIQELAQKPGVDHSAMPLAIQKDLRLLQEDRFVEDSLAYEELRTGGLQIEKFNYCFPEPYSEITQQAIAFAYEHFPDSEVSCATEVARRYISIPIDVLKGCAMFQVASLMIVFIPMVQAPAIFIPIEASFSCGLLLGLPFRTCLKKQCLDAALPHYKAPRGMRMELDVPDGSFVRQGQFPVDEDTSEEDVVYNEGDALLENE